jgi:hypothetical protein
VRFVALAGDHAAVASNTDEALFADRHGPATPDGHRALLAHDHPTAPNRPRVHVDVAVHIDVGDAIDGGAVDVSVPITFVA